MSQDSDSDACIQIRFSTKRAKDGDEKCFDAFRWWNAEVNKSLRVRQRTKRSPILPSIGDIYK